jgi:hypothetical protein
VRTFTDNCRASSLSDVTGPSPAPTPPPVSRPTTAEFLTPKEAARFLSVSRKQLETWRRTGTGPAFSKLGRRIVRYSVIDLRSWAERCRVTNTAQGHALRLAGTF